MASENAWGPVILCESCDDHQVAEYVLPQTGGVVMIVCRMHAEGWYDEDSLHLMNAARRLEPLGFEERKALILVDETEEDTK